MFIYVCIGRFAFYYYLRFVLFGGGGGGCRLDFHMLFIRFNISREKENKHFLAVTCLDDLCVLVRIEEKCSDGTKRKFARLFHSHEFTYHVFFC